MSRRLPRVQSIALAVGLTLLLAPAVSAAAPVKLVLKSHIGWEVNKTTKGTVCLVESEECQAGRASSEPVGFEYPEGVAGAPESDVYVSDRNNMRVQELTATGQFVLMFGLEVDETKSKEFHEPGNPHGIAEGEENVCSAASGDTCKAGAPGTGAGALLSPQGIAVEQGLSKYVYVEDRRNDRIDKYAANGEFVWAAGSEVDETKDKSAGSTEAERNLCTAASKDVCRAGVEREPSATGEKCPLDLKPGEGPGNALATDASSGAVYVADGQRILKIGPEGECAGEIPLPGAIVASAPTARITALAIDSTSAVVVYGFQSAVHELDLTSGNESGGFEVAPLPGGLGGTIEARTLAIDPSGRLAVTANEGIVSNAPQFGGLYAKSGGIWSLVTQFRVPGPIGLQGMRGAGFNGAGELFGEVTGTHELLRYQPELVAELSTAVGSICSQESVNEATGDVSLECKLEGAVNPEGVPNTEVWFEWGRSPALGKTTPSVTICTATCGSTSVPIEVTVHGVRPGEGSLYYRVRGYDENVKAPEEALSSLPPLASFATPTVPPRILEGLEASFVKATSAVLSGFVNPEGTKTTYEFLYAPASVCPSLEGCTTAAQSPTRDSAAYGKVSAGAEVRSLTPNTAYRYWLDAVNAKGEQAVNARGGPAIPEGEFTTTAPPAVSAVTMPPISVGTTSALVAGVVESGGQEAVYTFEVGVDSGASPHLGVVFSGSVPAVTGAQQESLGLTGLQPGAKYVYRLAVHVGNGGTPGSSAVGEIIGFETPGVMEGLPGPTAAAELAIPNIRFPAPAAKCRHGYVLTHGKCMRRKKRAKSNRGVKGLRRPRGRKAERHRRP